MTTILFFALGVAAAVFIVLGVRAIGRNSDRAVKRYLLATVITAALFLGDAVVIAVTATPTGGHH